MRAARTFAAVALVAQVIQPAAAAEAEDAAAPAIASWYTQTFTRGDAGLNVTSMWSLGSKFRSETVARGHKIVTIVNGDTYYTYDETAMRGIAIRRAASALAADAPNRRPFGNEAEILIEEGGEKVREDGVAGERADVYQITDENGRRIVWATQGDQRLPIRLEFFNRKTGTTRYKDYVDWAAGFPISDAFFEPGPGIEFERLGLEEYLESTLEKNAAPPLPIIYPDLLHGPPPK